MPDEANTSTEQTPVAHRELEDAERDEVLQRAAALRRRDAQADAVPGDGTKRPCHESYVELDGPDLRNFLEESLQAAIEMLGAPAVPVRVVHLRLSQPIRSAPPDLKRNFQLTEVVDAAQGEFCIYLSRRPGQRAFYGQFAHEVAHLLNPRLYDCYVEGLNTVFAEQFLKNSGRAGLWAPWEQHLQTTADASELFYSRTYDLMRHVTDLAAAAATSRMLQCTIVSPSSMEDRMCIDIDRWLTQEVSASTRSDIIRVIENHAGAIAESRRTGGYTGYAFRIPQACLRRFVLETLNSHRPQLRGLGVRSLALFGSGARGDLKKTSDLDFLVEFDAKSFDKYMELKFLLEDLFGRRVDVVLADSLKPRLREQVLKDVVHAEGF